MSRSKEARQRLRMVKTQRLKLDINIFSFEIAGKFLQCVNVWNFSLKAAGIRYFINIMNSELIVRISTRTQEVRISLLMSRPTYLKLSSPWQKTLLFTRFNITSAKATTLVMILTTNFDSKNKEKVRRSIFSIGIFAAQNETLIWWSSK